MSGATAIKLFGKTISQPSTDFSIDSTKATSSSSSSTSSIHLQQQKPLPSEEIIKQENGAICENPSTPSLGKEVSALESPTKEEHSDTSNSSSQEKNLVKPDQIIPCPRCNSMDTKFCYFNNYNVNQPRHFCRRCQRYWTAGGTMRNVPVGAGRRKNKQLSYVLPHCEQILQPRVNLGSNESTKSHLMVSNLIQKGINDNSHNLPGYNPLQAPHYIAPHCIAPPRLPGFHASLLSHPSTHLTSFPTFPGSWNTPSILFNNPSSKTLGKHSRDEISEQGVWVPKTLRIDDPSEASKSSIWASLGHKNEKSTSKNVGGLFNDLHWTGNNQHETRVTDQVSVLQANPAAMSRSHNFHETT